MVKRSIAVIFCFIFILTLFAGCANQNQTKTEKANIKITDSMADQGKIDNNLKNEVSAGHSFDDPFITLNPYGNAPLSAIAIFKTDMETGIKMKITGHDAVTDIVNQFPKATDHVIPIFGLYAGKENVVVFTTDDGTSKEVKIKTDSVKSPLDKAKLVKADTAQMVDGLTFLSLSAATGNIACTAYDSKGELRWILNGSNTAWAIRRLTNGRILVGSDKKEGSPYYNLGIREIDLLGKTYLEYNVPAGYHHDAREMPNGNFLVCTQKAGASTFEDVVEEIDYNTGAVVKTFYMSKILPMDDGGSLLATKTDWFHNNAVWFDSKTNTVMMSGRHANAVVALDYNTGNLKWILGDSEGWTKVDRKYFFKPVGIGFEWQYAQHAFMITPEGYPFMFDNGVYRAKKTNESQKLSTDQNYSRAVMYKIDVNNMTIQQIWQYGKELGADWYSSYISDVDYFSAGHYLIDSGGQMYNPTKKTHEANPSDTDVNHTASIVEIKNNQPVFEMNINTNVYRVERMKLYTNNNDFDLNATGTIKGKLPKQDFINNLKVNESNIKAVDFKLDVTQEPERLVVSGTWNKGKTPKAAKLIIKSLNDNKYYGSEITIPASVDKNTPTPYFNWISTNGLSGMYHIYIQTDNTLYDTKEIFEVK